MSRESANWTVGLALVLGALGNTQTAMAQPGEPLTLSLLVVDQSGVLPMVLARAEAETTRIYSRAGVRLIWTDGSAPDADFRFVVKIVATTFAAREVDPEALGVASGTRIVRGTIAYAFFGRIQEFTERHGLDTAVILGHVIAHEVGHLLLPHDAHTMTGLMRGRWDDDQARCASRGALMFNDGESALIRRTLVAQPR